MTAPAAWGRRDRRGGADELHGLDLDASEGPSVWRLSIDRPAVVLGSAQPAADVDVPLASRLGFGIARRRSGGGAVVLVPGEVVWCDLAVPAGDAAAVVDVGGQFVAAGERWRAALGACGVATDRLAVLPGGTRPGILGRVVCFGGLGPGEVVQRSPRAGAAGPDGAKLVGLSQRRTRAGVRVQGLVHRRLDAGRTAALLAPGLRRVGLDPDRAAAELVAKVATIDVDEVALADALADVDVPGAGSPPPDER
ncbi:MAG: hypothetical protein U0Q07_08615 [Acidimicrobiales bacterium]